MQRLSALADCLEGQKTAAELLGGGPELVLGADGLQGGVGLGSLDGRVLENTRGARAVRASSEAILLASAAMKLMASGSRWRVEPPLLPE